MPRFTPTRWHRDLGRRLKKARLATGLTMEALAHDLGITYQIYQRYEAGTARVPADMAVKLGKRLGIELHWLLGVTAA